MIRILYGIPGKLALATLLWRRPQKGKASIATVAAALVLVAVAATSLS
jgi:hypothetical protein